ncbi:Nudix hydrolase 3 [Altererythrobacter epoxidivorans]|uniref:Nudix hydrolase 3 n=2 Tax=Altererythrobacter epoxidivorans TaxID=361183 RepID=A0A0M4LUW1_9SPHN|nr:Nudix hydrolase 3 [Altererythrobacter epoxidivorans]
MRLAALPLLLATAACVSAPVEPPASTAAPAEAPYDLNTQKAKLAVVPMTPDTSYLSAEERQVVNLLIEASGYMSEIYKRQRIANYEQARSAVANNRRADRDLLLEMFDRNFGPWDNLGELHPFWGSEPMPEGAGFYPTDLTREEFDAYLAAHPEQVAALTSDYTVVRRDGDRLVAVPYSEAYKEWLVPASMLLEQASQITTNPSLKKFLSLRAKSFLTDDYFESELAWMDLEGTPIEVAIGPYEVYTDRLYGKKTAFESFVTLKDPEASASLAKYKAYLRDMEANLPIEDRYKNFQRGFASPIAVADQIQGGGDNVPGVQTIAFNLPNDERVREAKGAKKVILSNVLGAKYDRILAPIGKLVLSDAQAPLVVKKYMQLETLFHELSHSLGPGTIVKDGRTTTVNAELKDRYSALEESKADVMGVWNLLFMMEKGELPIAEKNKLWPTYFAGMFRAMRFGITEAHGQGAALQYGYLKEKGAFRWDAAQGHFVIDPVKMEAGLKALLHDQLMLQANGDYEGTKAFFDKYARLDDHAEAAIAAMEDIPVDILPVYPKGV